MNIAKFIRKPLAWFENLKLLSKLIVGYLICGALPMLFMMGFYFQSTMRLLQDQAFQNARQDMAVLENSLTSSFQPYETILETFKNDKNLNTLLGLNYDQVSYGDLAYYTNTTLDDTLALYPSISWIRFYSNNDTLPADDFYFFHLNEMGEQARAEVERADSSITASSWLMRRGEEELILVSRMNYFSSNVMENYIALGIDMDSLNELFQTESSQKFYLLDANGIVICGSDETDMLQDFSNIVSDWAEIENGEIVQNADPGKKGFAMIKSSLDMGMTLVLTIDSTEIFLSAIAAPLQMLGVFLIFSLVLLIVVAYFTNNMNKRLHRIIEATERIGSGDFDWELEDRAGDEFGQISQAVNSMNHQIDGLIRENYQKQLEIKISDLNLLQEQINPHFLYNALAVISSMALREGAKQTIYCIRYLADFYRISLNKGRQVIHVEEEIDLLKNYMKIQMIRFSDILEISYDVDEAVGKYYTIKLLLQPLVENAIHHAREEEVFLHIKVSCHLVGERVCYDVEDDGVGMDEATLTRMREELLRQEDGFGLKNVDKRIKLTYGNEYGASIDSKLGEGTHIHLEIPARESR